jgi:hypothetical protein
MKRKIKLLICGGRDFNNFPLMIGAIEDVKKEYEIEEIVHGDYKGADALAKKYCKMFGVPEKPFPADWDKYDKAAGPIRNSEMAVYCKEGDVCLAFWDGKSTGTNDMKRKAGKMGMIIKEVRY